MRRRLAKTGEIVEVDIERGSVSALLKIWAEVNDALERCECFTTKNIVGDRAEAIVCQRLNLIQEVASNAYWDAISDDGKKVQIKARRLTGQPSAKAEREMGAVSEKALAEIDYVAVVLFNEDFSANAAYLIEASGYAKLCVKAKDGYRLYLTEKRIRELDADPSASKLDLSL